MQIQRKIIHCDCDCFYASIEMRDNPSLREQPLAVGGSPNRRGVVATCNYLARSYGIHSAMSASRARQLCPDLIIVRPQMEKYRKASDDIQRIFHRYTRLVEPLSLDEAYLDVSNTTSYDGSASKIAEAIRKEIRESVGITISAGIGPNKFIAKIASDWKKPDGQFTVLPNELQAFVDQLPIKKLHGVGKVTAAKMQNLGLTHCSDIKTMDIEELKRLFGKFGVRLLELSKGIDNREVTTHRVRKSISVETTFERDLVSAEDCLKPLVNLEHKLLERWQPHNSDYRIIKQFVKLKFHDFTLTTAEMMSNSIKSDNFTELVQESFARGQKSVRLLGVGLRVLPIDKSSGKNKNETDQSSNESQLTLPLN